MKIANRVSRIVWVAVTVGSVSSVASGSLERTGYAGAACVRRSSSAATAADYLISQGKVYNGSGSANLTLDCGAVRKHFSGTGITAGKAIVLDSSSIGNVLCEMRSDNPLTGSSMHQSRTTTGFASAPMTLTYTGLPADGADNFYYWFCSIPPVEAGSGLKSAIYTLQIENQFSG